MIRTFLMAVAALLAAACMAPAPMDQAAQPGTAATFIGIDGHPLVTDGILDNSVQEALTANPAACATAGGSIQPVCRMQSPMCVIKFADAGKTCSDGAECGSGRCLAVDTSGVPNQPAKGQCSRTNDPCGCYQRIENGVTQPALCAD